MAVFSPLLLVMLGIAGVIVVVVSVVTSRMIQPWLVWLAIGIVASGLSYVGLAIAGALTS